MKQPWRILVNESPIHQKRIIWGWFNMKMPYYQYNKSHYGDKTILPSSYLHNGISHIGKTICSYWIRASEKPKPETLMRIFSGIYRGDHMIPLSLQAIIGSRVLGERWMILPAIIKLKFSLKALRSKQNSRHCAENAFRWTPFNENFTILFNTLMPKYWHFADDIFKCIFLWFSQFHFPLIFMELCF